jgi:GNAT superfamily N-acetyltransferase
MSLSIRALKPSETTTFIKSQWLFYKDDPFWVPAVVADRQKLLNIKKNPIYKHTQIQLFVAEREGTIVGRIAAIKNGNHLETHHDGAGFFGFFECVQDQGVASALFAAAERWLRDHGVKLSRGPVNPSMNDESGLLVHGFDGPPVFLMTYNPPYYADLIEGAGYHKVKDLYAYWVPAGVYRGEKMMRLIEAIKQRNQITYRNVDFKNKEQFWKDVELIKQMYNTAWQPNWGFVKMTDEEFRFLADDLKQVADPEFVFFVEVKGRPAGFILALPDVNQALIHNRRGSLLGAGYQLTAKRKRINRIRIIVLGVLPEFQRSGADTALYHEIGERGMRKGMVGAEASWILEDNEMMNKGLTHTMQADRYRTYRLYERAL